MFGAFERNPKGCVCFNDRDSGAALYPTPHRFGVLPDLVMLTITLISSAYIVSNFENIMNNLPIEKGLM